MDITPDPESHPNPSSWDKFVSSVMRIATATLIAVPATAILTAILFLVPPSVALGIAICGLVALKASVHFNKPSLVIIGGVSMFAGLLSWGFRQ